MAKTYLILVYDITRIGGAEKVAINLANEFSNYEKVVLVSFFMSNSKPIVKLDEKVHLEVLSKKTKSLMLSLPYFVIKLRKMLKKHQPSSILSITAGMNTIVWLASRGMKCNRIYAEHSNLKNNRYGRIHRFRQRIGSKKMDKIVVLTKDDKNAFIKKFSLSENKIHVIYNWVDNNYENLVYTPSKKIVSVGRLVDLKGFDRAIEIANILSKEIDFVWDIYGDGPEKNNLNNMIERYNLSNYVNLKGESDEIINLLPKYSLFVSTSTFEGFPLSFLEARNAGLPIISFDCPTGPKEIISNGRDGILVVPYNINKMSEEILALLKNKNLMRQMSNNIRSTNDKFSKDSILVKWKEVLNDE